MEKVNLRELASSEPWTPIGVDFVGDTALRVVRIEGKYEWHRHNREEFFLVVSGVALVETETQRVELSEGEVCKVPAETLHRSQSPGGAVVLIIEPATAENQG